MWGREGAVTPPGTGTDHRRALLRHSRLASVPEVRQTASVVNEPTDTATFYAGLPTKRMAAGVMPQR